VSALAGGLVAGKVALVTGAGSGIGRASALAFAREGARVVVSDVDAASGRAVADEILRDGAPAIFVRCDVTREAEVAALVQAALDAFGRIDCAHNNAGGPGQGGRMHEIPTEEWNAILALNLTGVFLCMKHEIPVMTRQGSGAIVNTSSGAGLVAVPLLAHYAAAKHGVLGLTKTAATENARTGLRINAICPGSVETPALRAHMAKDPAIAKGILATQPGGRLGRPEEIAEAVIWLCSDRASFVTGESFVVDGGAVAR
jgi:NAD(P)-dependent dehydrogenase (short-subunit alcohol dehydrogenase family)